MDQIRVIVAGPFTSPPFAAGLQVLLAESGRFDVVGLGAGERLDELLVDDRPVTLIAEGSDLSGSLDLLESSPNLSVVLIDPVRTKTFIGLENPSWTGLVRVIEMVADAARESETNPPQSRLRLVRPDELLVAEDGNFTGDGISPLRQWLDLTFGLHLLGRCEASDGDRVPGWTLSPMDALTALGFTHETTELAVRERLIRAERDLIVDRDHLPTTLTALAQAFDLSDRQLRMLCLVLAPEIDGRYGWAIGVLSDDLTARRPSLTLLAELLGAADGGWELRRELALPGSLVDCRLMGPDRSSPGLIAVDVGYRLQPAVLAMMLSNTLDDAAKSLSARVTRPQPIELAPSERNQVDSLSRLISTTAGPHLIEVRGSGDSAWFERVAHGSNMTLIRGDVRLLDGQTPPDLAVSAWLILGALTDSGVLIVGLEALDRSQVRQVADAFMGAASKVPLVAISGSVDDEFRSAGQIVGLDPPMIPETERADLWLAAARRAGLSLAKDEAHSLSLELRLDPAEIAACVARCQNEAADGEPITRRLRVTAGDMRRRVLPSAVRRVETVFGWDDIVLAEHVMSVLRSISDHVTHSGRVLTSWGFSTRLPYGQGVAALFSGPSGTGKTMAAQIIAADLSKELLCVDLSKTISKYIGETEKNIDGVFEVAEQRGAVLLFDEADALFGKRSEVKDAHDRHANVEVAYLLQRLEAFTGVAVLTSNLKQNIDRAFLRRLRFVIDFPLPDVGQREAIWCRSFPADTALADDIDLAFLARRLKLTGGTIQQIALHAAFAAAADSDRVHMHHVVAATRRELVKLGMFNMDKTLEERAA